MKNMKKIGLIALMALTVVFNSCSSDDDNGGTGGTGSGSFLHAKVDGTQFKAEVMGQPTVGATRIGSGPAQIISVIGGIMDGTNVSISLLGVTEAGTYELSPDSDSVIAYTTAGGAAAYGTGICAGATGQIKITTLTAEKIEGTFTFTGKDGENCSSSKSITNGSFRGMFSN